MTEITIMMQQLHSFVWPFLCTFWSDLYVYPVLYAFGTDFYVLPALYAQVQTNICYLFVCFCADNYV